jgi:hypothetical protein
LQGHTTSAIYFLDELREFAGNLGGMAINDGCVTCADLRRVFENEDLSDERYCFLGGVTTRMRSNVSTANVLNGTSPMSSKARRCPG